MTKQNPAKLPLLRSESAAEFLALRTRLNQEVKPQGVIEERYFATFATAAWQIERLDRLKATAIRLACPRALRNVLEQLLVATGVVPPQAKAQLLAKGWFENNPDKKEEVANLFRRFDLDESAIEAEAMNLTLPQQQIYDRSLALASTRLDKVLRMVMDYRGSDFAKRLRQKFDQIRSEPKDPEGLDSGNAEQKAAA